MMALPRDIASVEVHASDNQDQSSDRWQNGGVLTSAEVGQGSILIRTESDERSNIMEPSQANEPARSGPALRQLSTITLGDLQNALKNMTSVVSTEQTVPNSGNGQESLSAVMG